MRIAVLQPEVPHYREDFFCQLRDKTGHLDVFVYNSFESTKANGFSQNKKGLTYIPNCSAKGILFYNPWKLMVSKYDLLVLMLHHAHITTWLLLVTKVLHRKKIIVWGQGMSNKRYLREVECPNQFLKWMIRLADGVWIYMPKECSVWQKLFPNKPIEALGNTISGVTEMATYKPSLSIEQLKQKYGIKQDIILIFCARFSTPLRRTDLLEAVIQRLDKNKYGFIIIGDGNAKPDFSKYSNVYDYGSVYDNDLKKELFAMADLYFQPAWLGLSVIEAMAYGKPACSFKRSENIKQGVEVDYIDDGKTGILFSDMDDCINRITSLTKEKIAAMGTSARNMVQKKATIEKMVDNAYRIIKVLNNK